MEVKSPCGEESSNNMFAELSLNVFLVSYQLFMYSDMKGKAWDFTACVTNLSVFK